MRFDSGSAQALGRDSSGDGIHAVVHGDVSEGEGVVGRGARFLGGGSGVQGVSTVNGGGGLFSLPNVLRRCTSYACAHSREAKTKF